MKKNLEFLNSLPKKMYAIRGSLSLALQCEGFRQGKDYKTFDDIDITIDSGFGEIFSILGNKFGGQEIGEEIDCGPYNGADFQLHGFKFSDGSKIDFIIDDISEMKIDSIGLYQESILKIAEGKINCIKQNFGKDEYKEKVQQHKEDIIFLIRNDYLILTT